MFLLRPLFSLHLRLWLLLLALTAVMDATARTWRPDEVPIPYLQDARRYVRNPEGILSAAAVDSIDRLLFALERDKGVQTVVMVLDRLEGNDPYEFAMSVARKYGVGSKQKRTGLVIVLATGDRSYQFLTGNGLEGTLPDGAIQRIEDRIFVPRLKRQDWDGAMVSAVAAIDGICRGDESLSRGEIGGREDGWVGWMFLLIAVISIGGTAFAPPADGKNSAFSSAAHATSGAMDTAISWSKRPTVADSAVTSRWSVRPTARTRPMWAPVCWSAHCWPMPPAVAAVSVATVSAVARSVGARSAAVVRAAVSNRFFLILFPINPSKLLSL